MTDKLEANLLRKPVITVFDYASLRVKGNTLFTHWALEPWELKYGLILSVVADADGTHANNSLYVKFNCTPFAIVRKSLSYSKYPQL